MIKSLAIFAIYAPVILLSVLLFSAGNYIPLAIVVTWAVIITSLWAGNEKNT